MSNDQVYEGRSRNGFMQSSLVFCKTQIALKNDHWNGTPARTSIELFCKYLPKPMANSEKRSRSVAITKQIMSVGEAPRSSDLSPDSPSSKSTNMTQSEGTSLFVNKTRQSLVCIFTQSTSVASLGQQIFTKFLPHSSLTICQEFIRLMFVVSVRSWCLGELSVSFQTCTHSQQTIVYWDASSKPSTSV